MNEEYVRKDTFEAVMQEIRTLMATSNELNKERIAANEARMSRELSEMKASNETFKAEVRQELSEMKGEIADMRRLIVAVNDKLDSTVHFFGVALSIAGVIFTALQIYIALK